MSLHRKRPVRRKNYLCGERIAGIVIVEILIPEKMKMPYRISRFVLAIITVYLTTVSCSKNETADYEHYISAEYAISYSLDYINTLFDTGEEMYPELGQIKPLVTSSVRVYKLVYRTEVNNREIKASGLVCLPDGEGDYPVLCFQNGTNTENNNAPSEFFISPLYQMVEAVASTGYIVVIPDYPGFGESADIPHPYLIKEPTVRSIVDMLYALNEIPGEIMDGVSVLNEYSLIGYSQGGWATLALHKALELDYDDDFNLKGSACGAGPYNLSMLFNGMIGNDYYSMPVYLGYIINAYSAYDQFTNNVNEILNQPYAGLLSSLYTGELSSDEINAELTTSIPELLTSSFIEGFTDSPNYATVREALVRNSITGWKTEVPLYFVHGDSDTQVDPSTTINIYDEMMEAGTSAGICTREMIPGADHGEGVVPGMVKGLMFLMNL